MKSYLIILLLLTTFLFPYTYAEERDITEMEKRLELDPNNFNLHMELGDLYERKGEYDKALDIYKRATKLKPESGIPYIKSGRIYQRLKRYDEASKEFKTALLLDPKNTYYMKVLGELYLKQGRVDKAKREWERIIEINPEDISAYKTLSLIYYNYGMITEAISVYLRARDVKKDDYLYAKELGDLYRIDMQYKKCIQEYLKNLRRYQEDLEWTRKRIFEIGEEEGIWEDIITWIKEEIERGVKDYNLHILLGDFYIRKKSPDLACIEYEKAFKIAPDNGRLFMDLANRLRDERFYEHAIQVYQRIISYFPKFKAEAMFAVGSLEIELSCFDKAIETFFKLIDIYPGSSLAKESYQRIGDIYFTHLSNYDKALSVYKILLDKFPKTRARNEIQFKISECLFKKGDFRDAREEYKKVQGEFLDSALFKIGECYYFEQKFTPALRVYEDLIDRFPRSIWINDALKRITIIKNSSSITLKLLAKGEFYYNNKEFPKARAEYQRIIDENKGLEDIAYFKIGKLLFLEGANKEALEIFKKLIADYPDSPLLVEAKVKIGEIYERLKEYDEALEIYTKILKEYPDNPLINEARKRIREIRKGM